MTSTWIIVNIALALAVSAVAAGVSVLVPLRLDRGPAVRARRTSAPAASARAQVLDSRLAA